MTRGAKEYESTSCKKAREQGIILEEVRAPVCIRRLRLWEESASGVQQAMIYYPLCTLMLAGIRDILVISTLRMLPSFKPVADGSQYGIRLQYQGTAQAEGIAQGSCWARNFSRAVPALWCSG